MDRLAAWWSAWKWVAILLLVLALSVWVNLVQWRSAATAPLRAENAALADAIEDAAKILIDNAESAERLRAAASAASTQLAGAGRDYRAAARATPLTAPSCAPGQGRVDAINRALGAEPAP